MPPRQTSQPRAWAIVRPDDEATVRRLPPGTGVMIVDGPASAALLRRARLRGLRVVVETEGGAARVHGMSELRRALLRRTPLILLSPLYPTRTHPEWTPIPRMRAAAIARLAKRQLFALGGMNLCRFARIAPLGFIGWAGIGAWSAR